MTDHVIVLKQRPLDRKRGWTTTFLKTAQSLRLYIYGHFFLDRIHYMSGIVVHLLGRPTLARIRAPGTKLRSIMCLLVGVIAKVQAPRWVAC